MTSDLIPFILTSFILTSSSCVTYSRQFEPYAYAIVPSVVYAEQENYILLRTNIHTEKFRLQTYVFNQRLLVEEEHSIAPREDGWYGADIPYRPPVLPERGKHVELRLKFTNIMCVKPDCQLENETISFSERIRVLFWPFIVLGEIEKPIYRPGENIRLRFVAIKPQFSVPYFGPIVYPRKQIIEKFEKLAELIDLTVEDVRALQTPHFSKIYILNSKYKRIKQWLHVSPLDAINLNFNIPQDAPEGDWSVVAELSGHEDKTVRFKVEQYVLPRFVAKFILPTDLNFQSKRTSLSVCVKYTDGRRLPGSVKAIFCVCSKAVTSSNDGTIMETNVCPKRHRSSSWSRPCVQAFRLIQKDGCAHFNMSTDKLNLTSQEYPIISQVPILCAEVEEEGTGSKMSRCERGAEIEHKSTDLDIITPPVFKVGLPLSGFVHLKHVNPLEANNVSIKIRLHTKFENCLENRIETVYDQYELDVLTDQTGIASFVIPPISLHETITLEAIYKVAESPLFSTSERSNLPKLFDENNYSTPRSYEIRRSANVLAFRSQSDIGVQSWPKDVPIAVTCPGNVTVQMLANTPLHNRTIYVQTIVRGKLLQHRIDPVRNAQPCIDQDGGYTCLVGDHINCHAGWIGSDCRQPICAPSCHPLGGQCERQGECQCRPGWNGTDCDQCREKQGCEHGRCVRGDDCVCEEGWIGDNCQHILANSPTNDIYIGSYNRPDYSNRIRSIGVRKMLYIRQITFGIDGNWGPEANVVIFFFHDGIEEQHEIIAMSMKIRNLHNCMSPAMSLHAKRGRNGLEFDRSRAAPGETIHMYINPTGLTQDVRSVMRSRGAQIDNQLCFTRISDIALDNFEGHKHIVSMEKIQKMIGWMLSREKWRPEVDGSLFDAFGLAGLNLAISQFGALHGPSQRCTIRGPEHVRLMEFNQAVEDETVESNVDKPRLRDFFPEVWLFDVMPIDLLNNDSSNPVYGVHRELKTPDSITTWRASVFCTTKQNGLWVPQPKEITVSMPFHVELTLPKEVKRGEILYLPISVFVTLGDQANKKELASCLEVTVTTDIDHREWTYVGPSEYSCCLCEGEKRTFQLGLLPQKLGNLNVTAEAYAIRNSPMCTNAQKFVFDAAQPKLTDRQRRHIRVVPEGIPKERSMGAFLCYSPDKQIAEQSFQLGYPKNLVEGSLRTYLSYTDEVFGGAIGNLDRLVRLPMGCGEQNMLLVASNVYVLDYLTSVPSVNQAQTERLIKSARKHIVMGYNLQLKYRHEDGSYSAFGQSDGEGSSWLTAYVLRVFAKAHHINSKIDVNWDKLFDETSKFLQSRQNVSGSGCFEEKGRVIHREMQGSSSEHVGDKLDIRSQILTSYISAALHEMPVEHQRDLNETYKHASRCSIPMDEIDKISTYELAQLAYTMRRTQSHGDNTVKLKRELIKRSLRPNVNTLHWITPHSPPTSAYSVQAVDIETTSYAYLSLVDDPLTRTDALSIIRWLNTQQNPNGGFSSTQDTVLALEAISDFAKRIGLSSSLAKSVPFDVHARINPIGYRMSRTLTPETRRVLNTVELSYMQPINATEVTWKIKSTALNSSGCLAVQTIQYYNVHESESKLSTPFRLMHHIEQSTNPTWDACIRPNLTICLQMSVDLVNHYDSGMLLMRIHMVSGWKPSSENLLNLMGNATESIRHLEFDDMGIVSVYFNGFTKKEAEASGGWTNIKRCVELKLEQINFVQNIQPAQILAMDYYATERSTSIEYRVDDCRGAWSIEDGKELASDKEKRIVILEPQRRVNSTQKKLVCPVCKWPKMPNSSISEFLLTEICKGDHNLFLVGVFSRQNRIYNVSIAKFGKDNVITKWNATLNTTTCDCVSLEPQANLIYLGSESSGFVPGQPEVFIVPEQTNSALLNISDADVWRGLQSAANSLKTEQNSRSNLMQLDPSKCARIFLLEAYIRGKVVHPTN